MPTCSQCLEVKSIECFSDAQLLGRLKCLRCSNPRLHAKKQAELGGAAHLIECASTPRASATTGRPSVEVPGAPYATCTMCRRELPRSRFSARQLHSHGKGRCSTCATQATADNVAQQSSKKRSREPVLSPLDNSEDDNTDDEQYARELLDGVEHARLVRNASGEQALPPALGEHNQGYRMLRRLGWEPGQHLGEADVGPMELPTQCDTRGLGSSPPRAQQQASPTEQPSRAAARPIYPDELRWTEHEHEHDASISK